MELLKIKGLKKNYINEKQVICALKSINLTVFENEFLVIVGPSGCGKSTILSLLFKYSDSRMLYFEIFFLLSGIFQ